MIILLDSPVLGILSNPNITTAAAIELQQWASAHMTEETAVAVPEICDYEVRRELIRAGKVEGLKHLDFLCATLSYISVTTATFRRAAQLWAAARNKGIPTADRHALDADVILAAQALQLAATGHETIVATENVRHLSRFAPAARWQDIRVK